MHKADIEYTVGIITVSSSRFKKYGALRGIESLGDFDESGMEIYSAFKDVAKDYALVSDDIEMIRGALFEVLKNTDVCIITGGTGLSPSDVTVEAVKPLFTKEIEGFGEIFRMLSYQEIGSSALLSRATAGLIKDKIVFCLPGSKKAVKLAVNIIKPAIGHMLVHARGLA